MKRLRPLLIAMAALVLLVIALRVGWWAYHEARYRHALRKFSPGMSRKYVEDRLLWERTPFWQSACEMSGSHAGDGLFPQGSPFRQMRSCDESELGHDLDYSLVCSPTTVYLRLDFETQDPSKLSDADVLRSVGIARHPGPCL